MTALGRRADFVLESAVYTALYILFGALSFETAYLQPNAATIWLPSGFAVGLLLAKGVRFWPSIALGSFMLNAFVTLQASASGINATILVAAALVAIGNTAEANVGAFLAKRLANGSGFAFRTRSLAYFLLVVVPLTPIVSMLGGLASSWLNGSVTQDTVGDVALTWYIANAQGILLFGGITVLFMTPHVSRLKGRSRLEAVLLTVAIVLAVEIACGNIPISWLLGWPRPYMLIPFVILATFRFGSLGGLLAVALITLGMAMDTMNGNVAFPSDTPWRSLIYLQVYLAMLAVIALAMGAALAELNATRSELENRVVARTRAIEQLLEQRNVETALVAHDLKSPILGIRNALTAARTAIGEQRLSPSDLGEALVAMEQACSAIVTRIVSSLPHGDRSAAKAPAVFTTLQDMFAASLSAHRPTLRARDITMTLDAPPDLLLAHGSEVEHIVDTLIDNALRHTADGSFVRVVAARRGSVVEIKVSDEGPGIPEARQDLLFQFMPDGDGERRLDGASRSGLGLHLASKQAEWIGGALRYEHEVGRGAIFVLTVPDAAADQAAAE